MQILIERGGSAREEVVIKQPVVVVERRRRPHLRIEGTQSGFHAEAGISFLKLTCIPRGCRFRRSQHDAADIAHDG